MSSKQLFIIDPVADLNISKDTSSLLIREGLNRGHEIYICQLEHLILTPQFLKGRCQQVKDLKLVNDGYDLAEPIDQFLDEFDVIWLRKDPPFDETYLAHLSLFDHLTNERILFINDPAKISQFNEKLTIYNFPDYIAETIVTMDLDEIKAFWQQHDQIVVKSLTGFSGQGIELIKEWQQDLTKVKALIDNPQSFVMAQEFLPNISEGDKRVYLLDGEVIGQLLRLPQGSFKANIHAGGKAAATTLNQHEQEVAAAVGQFLKEHGIVFAGIDLIDGHLTEINITSPGVVVETNQVSGTKLEQPIWDYVEAQL